MARKTIGVSPLDAIIPAAKPEAARTPEAQEPGRKERMTVLVPAALLSRARDAVFWSPGLTMAALVEQAVEREIERLEKKRGEPFPKRKSAIRTGRPIKGDDE